MCNLLTSLHRASMRGHPAQKKSQGLRPADKLRPPVKKRNRPRRAGSHPPLVRESSHVSYRHILLTNLATLARASSFESYTTHSYSTSSFSALLSPPRPTRCAPEPLPFAAPRPHRFAYPPPPLRPARLRRVRPPPPTPTSRPARPRRPAAARFEPRRGRLRAGAAPCCAEPAGKQPGAQGGALVPGSLTLSPPALAPHRSSPCAFVALLRQRAAQRHVLRWIHFALILPRVHASAVCRSLCWLLGSGGGGLCMRFRTVLRIALLAPLASWSSDQRFSDAPSAAASSRRLSAAHSLQR